MELLDMGSNSVFFKDGYQDLQMHEYCLAMPEMNKEQYEALKNDISGSGLLEPIVLFEGRILDGRHRYKACLELDIQPIFTQFPGPDSPLDWVISRNIKRRHFTKAEFEILGVRIKEAQALYARRRQQEAGGDRKSEDYQQKSLPENFPEAINKKSKDSRDEAAKIIGHGVNGKNIDKAEKIIKNAIPEILEDYKAGKVSTDAAYEMSRLEKERQQELIKEKERITAEKVRQERKRVEREKKEAERKEYEKKYGKPYITLTEWKQLSESERQKRIEYFRESSKTFNNQKDDNEDSMGNIEWAKFSWNPVTGCKHDCPYCYARDIAERFYEQKFEPSFWPERLKNPSNTKLPAQAENDLAYKNVFSNSMSDLYGRWVPQEWIDMVFEAMKNNPQWNYLTLTKFPKRAAELQYPDNVWIGTSIDYQVRVKPAEAAFERIEAGVRWLSLEPLLEPLKFERPELFQWVVLGGASKSNKTPAWTPPADWIIRTAAQFLEHGASIYLKTNGRFREWPGAITPSTADEAFKYLKR